ncbi:type II toxin-antitoxin system RelE/ParE family toxin [Paenibacillus elgii]|uniref:type II toxin-antitoxin system RelE/ParE family toxin n=1 Tax=Paenibacillus elgii TaxID=189691 RepID=UPI002D7CAEA4|nr:type II toxin-antitoxin system RelE/ParE family toxin [Paenibacillus elgii]
MPPKSRVRYTPAAVDDLDEIFSYITQDNLQNAEKMLEKLNREIGGLADFLPMGSVLSEDDYTLIQRGYRFIVVSPYLIFYRIINNEVIIHRILHGRRDYLRELF